MLIGINGGYFPAIFGYVYWDFSIHSLFILGLVSLFEPNFLFSLVVFCSHAAFLNLIFCFFLFLVYFFGNHFPNSLIVLFSQ